ncbi:MAG: hypothetical protein IPK35_19680 [Saprospiraceae bacterium]|jgi:hypothetical protein|nr:hypothetical protein [Saprospiraceae bacterium]
MRNVFYFVIFICSCSNSKDDCYSIKNNINYDEILYATRKRVVDLTWSEQPFTYPEFANMTSYSECFKEDAIKIIKLNKHDETIIGLALWSMKELGSEETILFANDIIEHIDEDNLIIWLYGGYGNKNFIKNFKKSNYKDFFNLCINKFPNKKVELIKLRDVSTWEWINIQIQLLDNYD